MYKIMRHVAYWYQISQNPSKKQKNFEAYIFLCCAFGIYTESLQWAFTVSSKPSDAQMG